MTTPCLNHAAGIVLSVGLDPGFDIGLESDRVENSTIGSSVSALTSIKGMNVNPQRCLLLRTSSMEFA